VGLFLKPLLETGVETVEKANGVRYVAGINVEELLKEPVETRYAGLNSYEVKEVKALEKLLLPGPENKEGHSYGGSKDSLINIPIG
jgi:hypothetical protein